MAGREVSPLVLPTWNDYARSAQESEFPSLWDGRVADFVPALGNTGLFLADISGYENHGTLTNMDPGGDWVADPTVGWGLDFVSGSNDQIVCGSKPILDDLAPFSIGMWIYSRSRIDGRFFATKATTGGNFGWFFRFSGAGGQWNFQVDHATTDLQGTWGGSPTGSIINNDEWQFIVVTWTGGLTPSSALASYKNGIPVALSSSVTGVGARTTDASYSLCIGNVNGGTNQAADCIYGRTMIYNRILTNPEVCFLYENPYADLIPVVRTMGKAGGAVTVKPWWYYEMMRRRRGAM